MGTQSEYEIWNKTTSGVLKETPLILTACREGVIGNAYSYPGGAVYKTVFTYLCGKPDEQFIADHKDLIYESRLVCMSPDWEEYVRQQPVKFILRREVMEPFCSMSSKKLRPLPDGYSISPFTQEIFEAHPFDHGRNYSDYQGFADKGAGAAVLYNGQIVSAASSFLTFGDQVELDVSTAPEHREKGLADHCVYEMLRQCSTKNLIVHWDAQNPMSSGMAKGHGFIPAAEYAVYWVERNEL